MQAGRLAGFVIFNVEVIIYRQAISCLSAAGKPLIINFYITF
jgi:hypothetical protein